jgi:hypothetical protein
MNGREETDNFASPRIIKRGLRAVVKIERSCVSDRNLCSLKTRGQSQLKRGHS